MAWWQYLLHRAEVWVGVWTPALHTSSWPSFVKGFFWQGGGGAVLGIPFCVQLSLAAESWGHSPAAVQWLRLLQGKALGCSGAVAPELATQHVGPSQTKHRTFVPHIARQILNHWATREDLLLLYLSFIPYSPKLKVKRKLHKPWVNWPEFPVTHEYLHSVISMYSYQRRKKNKYYSHSTVTQYWDRRSSSLLSSNSNLYIEKISHLAIKLKTIYICIN